MKHCGILWMFFPLSAYAQIPVTDVAQIAQNTTALIEDLSQFAEDIAEQVEQTAQGVEQISNQVEQIQQLAEQIQQMDEYLLAFGDAAKIQDKFGLKDVKGLLDGWDLRQSFAQILKQAKSQKATAYEGAGLYQPIASKLEGFTHQAENYRPHAAMQKLTEEFAAYAEVYQPKAEALKKQLSQTLGELNTAKDATEMAKLQGKLQGLLAQQDQLQAELARQALQAQVTRQEMESQRELSTQATEEELAERNRRAGQAILAKTISVPKSRPVRVKE